MPVLPITPREAVPDANEFHSTGSLAQMDLSALDVQVNIDKLLTRLYADLQVVEEAIQTLELISKRFRGSSMPRPLTAQIPKPSNVVDIHSKRG